MSTPRTVAWWGWATAFGALTALVLALLLAGGAPPPAPPGLADAARVPSWLGLLVSLLSQAAGIAAAGFALLAGGLLDRPRPAARSIAAATAVLWAAITVLQIGLATWELEGRTDVLGTSRVQALLLQLGLALITAVLTGLVSWTTAAVLAVVTAVAGLLPTVVDGHPRSADRPLVTATAVSLHVAGAALWVGGLAALGWLALTRADRWDGAIPRYARMALVAVVVLAASGVVAALGQIDRPAQLLSSKYGAIVLLKVVMLGALVAAGRMQRSRVIEHHPIRRRHFLGLAGLELTVMALAIALAVALGHTPPPA